MGVDFRFMDYKLRDNFRKLRVKHSSGTFIEGFFDSNTLEEQVVPNREIIFCNLFWYYI